MSMPPLSPLIPTFEEQILFSYGLVSFKDNSVFVSQQLSESALDLKQKANEVIREKLFEDYSIDVPESVCFRLGHQDTDSDWQKHIETVPISFDKSLIIEFSENTLDIFLKTKKALPISLLSDSVVHIYKFFITEHFTSEKPPASIFLKNLRERITSISDLV